jgi:hypothetical protein
MSKFTPSNISTNPSFEDWVDLIFDNPVIDNIKDAWYWDFEWSEYWEVWDKNSKQLTTILYAIRLFENPGFLLNHYSIQQIDDGMWFITGGPIGLSNPIWNKRLPLRPRQRCIRSMTVLFEELFTKIPDSDAGACFMWWDILREWDHQEDRDLRIKDVMFQTICGILQMPLRHLQMSALHGLGHMKHPDKKKVVEDYLARNINLDDEIREYALIATEGKVL